MSHVANIDVEILDLDVVKEICEALGLVFQENQRHYRWYGRHVGDYPLPEGITKDRLGFCDHALSVKGGGRQAYEIGLVRQGAKWAVLWDFWMGGHGLEACVGKDGIKFAEAYSKAVGIKTTKQFAKAKGWTYTEKVDEETSETVILLRKY
jgi:hypothetical protein